MKTHIVIPARLASTRLPRKPLALLAGVPLIAHVAARASQAAVDDVTIAVDDEEVKKVVEHAGYSAVLTSPNHPSGSDRVYEVVEAAGWPDDDLVVNVQGDEPLLPAQVVNALVRYMCERSDVSMGTVSEPLGSTLDLLDPNIVKVVVDHAGHALYFSRAPIPYPRDEMNAANPSTSELSKELASGALQRHVGMYAFRVSGLRRFVALAPSRLEILERLEQLRWLEAGERLLVLPATEPVPGGVDTPEDLARVEALLTPSPIG